MQIAEPQTIDLSGRAASIRGRSLQAAKSRIPRNVLANWLSYGTNILVAFFLSPLLVHRLGSEAYGIWGLIGQLIEYSFLLDFGIRIAVARYVARHLALDQPGEINKVVTTGLAFNLVPMLLALVGGGALAYALPQFFPIPSALISAARWSVMILALGIAASFPGSLFHGCVGAFFRYDLLGIRNSLPSLVRLLLLWFFLTHGFGLVAVAAISTLTVCMGYALDLVFTCRQFPQLSIRREFYDSAILRALVNFSAYAFILSVAWRLIFMTDNVVVGFVLGPVAVTFYAVGLNLAAMLRDSMGNITMLYAPLAYQMEALDERGALRRLFVSGSRIALLYALPGVLGLVILGPRFLGFWMGPSFTVKSGPILIALALEAGFCALSSASGQVLYAKCRHKLNAWASLCNATANFTLSVILIRWIGAVGVAWGTIIPAFIVETIVLPVYTASILGVSPLRFYRSAVLRPLLAALPFGLWLWVCRSDGLVRGYGSLTLVVASGLVFYVWLAWKLTLDSEEKTWARQQIGDRKLVSPTIRPSRAVPEEL